MKKKNEDITLIIDLVLKSILDLPTKNLIDVYIMIYKELIKRKDYSSLDDKKVIYEILKQDLIDEGVYNV